jgi:nucleoside-diphosphate-sugar epimerase
MNRTYKVGERKMKHLFCFGLGYSARELARLRQAQGWKVTGTCRTDVGAAALRAQGMAARRFDRDNPPEDAAADLAGVTHILSSVPPDVLGDPVLEHYGPAIAALESLAWAGYLSTTGVYGDRAGGWVDENSALAPTGARGRNRVAAETGWLALWRASDVPVHLFRLAGIYGPGRSALDTIRSGQAQRIIKPGQVFSRIHVADIAATLEASIARPNPGAAYNVCDDNPAAPDEVLAFAATLLGAPLPPAQPFETATLSEMARSFYADNKRVANERIKRELGVRLSYSDYRAGLKALLDGGQ